MELNLYGIASIQLDRLKGRQVRRILAYFTCCKSQSVCYLLVWIFSFTVAVLLLPRQQTQHTFTDFNVTVCPEVQTQFTEYLITVELPA